MIALDSNVLVYAHRAGAPQHLSSRRPIEEASQRYGVLPPAEASGFLRALVDAGVSLWNAGEFDLQIALISWEAGAREMWTHDRDFVTVPGLTVRDPIVRK